jgi:hypothetical protein
MDKTLRIIRLSKMFSSPEVWSARSRLLDEVHQNLRQIQYINSRYSRDYFKKSKKIPTEAKRSALEVASRQAADRAHARVGALFNRLVELRQLITELYPQFLGKLPIVDRVNFDNLDPKTAMQQFCEVQGEVLHRETEDYCETHSPSDWAKIFDISPSTFRRRIDDKIIRVREHTTKCVSIHRDDVARLTKKKLEK